MDAQSQSFFEPLEDKPSDRQSTDSGGLTVLYVTSRGHSGSTLLDLLLSGHSQITSVGELKMLSDPNPERKLCSCHRLEPERCPYWQQVEKHMLANVRLSFADLQLESTDTWTNYSHNHALYESVAAVSGCRTIVDSSKSLPRLRSLLQGVDRYGGYQLLPIHLLRGSLGLVHSYVKNGRISSCRDLAGVCYNYGRDFFRTQTLLEGRQHLFVSYEGLAGAPRQELRRIMAALSMSLEEQQLDWGQGVRHNIHGNDMRFRAGAAIRPDTSWKKGLTSLQILQVIWLTLPVRLSLLGLPGTGMMDLWKRLYKPTQMDDQATIR
jgi:hypothetical protein